MISTLLDTSQALLKIGQETYPYTPAALSGSVVLDKVASGNDASVIFRDTGAIKGKAGATGDDDIHFKVATGSPGSETFVDAIILKNSTGYVEIPLQLGVGVVPGVPLHVAASSSVARVAAKIENTNSTSSTSAGAQLEFKGNSAVVDWLLGTDFGENGTNNLFIQDVTNGVRLFIDTSGRVVLGGSSVTTTANNSLETAGSLKTLGTNSLSVVNLCGRQTTAGPPSASTWATGDLIFDSLNYPYYCTSGGTPGTWVGGGTKVDLGTGAPGTITGQKTGDVYIDLNTGNIYLNS